MYVPEEMALYLNYLITFEPLSLDFTDMHFSNIKFTKQGHGFAHNLNADFALFAVWEAGRPYIDNLRNRLKEKFDIIAESKIIWSENHFHFNAQRIYEAPVFETTGQPLLSPHKDKIGGNSFIIFIVRDDHPKYTYCQSVSGKIELSNINAVNVKYEIRNLIESETQIKYGVHSTNNIYEFFFQAPLILGAKRFKHILSGEKLRETEIKKDLEGAGGWNNYNELFEILNLTSNYLVQRGFETLPKNNPELDIDFLTDNYQRLASAIGGIQKKNQPYKASIKVGEEKISLDIRFTGDKYYDTAWSKNMLERKIIRNSVFVPREDDYFFSLLFHAKVQKPTVKGKYRPILQDLAAHLEFDWFTFEMLEDNVLSGRILKGYYEASGYYYENPIDKGVYKNKELTSLLPTPRHEYLIPKTLKQRVYPFVPQFLIQLKKRL